MSLPDVTIIKEIEEKKQSKAEIDVGTLGKAKVGEMEEKIREGRSRRTRKEVVGCVQAVIGNNKYLLQFKDRQKREMSSHSLSYVCSKEEVGQEVDEPISDLPPKEQGELLTIDGDPVVEEVSIFENFMYLSVFIFKVLSMRYQRMC